jgi:DNA-binding NtrC family response regulator
MRIVGHSQEVERLRREINRVADSDAKVLITGPTGSGKEMVARGIHERSNRHKKRFVTINCAAITESLLEAELFGHVRGSFTGAVKDSVGKLVAADGGTLFLDEVGDMSPRMQGIVLRFLENGEVQSVGGNITQNVNVRVVSATNADIKKAVADGTFRRDLYYRLKVLEIKVGSLCQHKEDIPELITYFSQNPDNQQIERSLEFTDKALKAMQAYDWPGNVRELRNMVEDLKTRRDLEIIDVNDLPLDYSDVVTASSAGTTQRDELVERLWIRITKEGESFWNTAYPLYMGRKLTGDQVRVMIARSLVECRGSYKLVAEQMGSSGEYKRFLNFLRKHRLQLPFKEFRQLSPKPGPESATRPITH